MTYEEYIQYLRMVATTASIDTLTANETAKIQRRISTVMNEIQNELANYAEVATEKGLDTARALSQRMRELELQSDIVGAITDDLAELTADAGDIAYPSYNNMVSWDGRVKDFSRVIKTHAELVEQASTAKYGGHTLRGWVETIYSDEQKIDAFEAILPEFVEDLEAGRLKGEGYRQMVARLRDKYQDYTEQDLITLARTYTQAQNVEAHTDVYEANSDIVKGVTWTAKLENGNTQTGRGTCPRCAALDGEQFTLYGQSADYPKAPECPLHPRCRCLLLPITKTWRELGLDIDEMDEAYRPWVIRTEEAIDAGGRRDILAVGHIQGNYGDFWKEQPEAIQDAIVGVQRARLIREGYLKFGANVGGRRGYYATGSGDMIPIVDLGLSDDVLFFARTGRWPDEPGGGTVPPAPLPPPAIPPTPAAQPAPGYREAATTREAEEIAAEMGLTGFYKTFDVDMANGVNNSWARMREAFPALKSRTMSVGPHNDVIDSMSDKYAESVVRRMMPGELRGNADFIRAGYELRWEQIQGWSPTLQRRWKKANPEYWIYNEVLQKRGSFDAFTAADMERIVKERIKGQEKRSFRASRNAWGYTWNTKYAREHGGVVINTVGRRRSFLTHYKNSSGEVSNWHPRKTTDNWKTALYTHEFGHNVDYTIRQSRFEGEWENFLYGIKREINNAPGGIGENVSRYADKNTFELVAEAITDVIDDEGGSEYSNRIVDKMIEYLNQI